MQVLKIDSFSKKMESAVRASTSPIMDLTYTSSQLLQSIDKLENLENERYGREDKISLGNPQWMEGSQDKGESPRSHA